MDAPRALRVYKGPDSPYPFMETINKLSFQCRNMADNMTADGIQKLHAELPNGKVTVMRVGKLGAPDYGMEFVYTTSYGGGINIVLIASNDEQYHIPVTLLPDAYRLKNSILTGAPGVFDIYGDYYIDPDYDREREACPYILFGGVNYTTVAPQPNLSGMSKYDDWHYHYSYYIGISQGSTETPEIFRPPWRLTTDPYWHGSISPLTASAPHLITSRYVEQGKRRYFPYDTVIRFGGSQSPHSSFERISFDNNIANLKLKAGIASYSGKRPYTYDPTASVYTSYGEVIVGTTPLLLPANTSAIQFFWPFIPYMHEIGHFDLLGYSPHDTTYGMAVLNTSMAGLYVWDLQYYTMEGLKVNNVKLRDSYDFNDSSYVRNYSFPMTLDNHSCYTGEGTETIEQITSPYSSSGVKHIPIGTTGNKGVCYVKNTWETSGAGPVFNSLANIKTTGNLPVYIIVGGGDPYMFGPGQYHNESTTTKNYTETASNSVKVVQQLILGDDIIDTAESNMSYSMNLTGNSQYSGSWDVNIEDVNTEIEPSCITTICYTTDNMLAGSTQALSPCDPVESNTYTWGVSGGGSFSGNVYTAPASLDCSAGGNPIITLYCNGNAVDTMTMGIYTAAVAGQTAWLDYTACLSVGIGGYLCTGYGPTETNWMGCGYYTYYCNGTHSALCNGVFSCGSYDPPCPELCAANCHARIEDKRSEALKAAGCCPEALA